MIYRPAEYAEKVYGGKVSSATIRNWIKANRLPKGHWVETTPTGQYLIHVDEKPKTKVDELFNLMVSRVA